MNIRIIIISHAKYAAVSHQIWKQLREKRGIVFGTILALDIVYNIEYNKFAT